MMPFAVIDSRSTSESTVAVLSTQSAAVNTEILGLTAYTSGITTAQVTSEPLSVVLIQQATVKGC